MNLNRLSDYLARIERRLRVLTITQGAAIFFGAALIATVLAVIMANHFAFSDPSVIWARVLLFIALALAVAFGLVVPLLHLNRRKAARAVEQKFPQFEELRHGIGFTPEFWLVGFLRLWHDRVNKTTDRVHGSLLSDAMNHNYRLSHLELT